MTGLLPELVGGTLTGLAASSAAIIFLLVGVSVALGFPKLRRSGPHTLIVRSLDEAVGSARPFLTPSAPQGPADQLDTPELRDTRRPSAS